MPPSAYQAGLFRLMQQDLQGSSVLKGVGNGGQGVVGEGMEGTLLHANGIGTRGQYRLQHLWPGLILHLPSHLALHATPTSCCCCPQPARSRDGDAQHLQPPAHQVGVPTLRQFAC